MSSVSPWTIGLCVLLLAVASHCQTPETCEVPSTPVFRQLCSNVSSIISFTRFPNVHGHSHQLDVDGDLFAFADVVSSDCDIDIELFICLYYFPTCRETMTGSVPVVQPPCQDFCLRIDGVCGSEISSRGIALDCSVLPSFDPVEPTSCYDPYHLIVLNEVNSENGNGLNYVEFWDFGIDDTILDNFFVALYDSDGVLVESFDLIGKTTRNGYFAIGAASNIRYDDIELTAAVALYRTQSSENISSPTLDKLVDALVYVSENDPVTTSLQLFPNNARLFPSTSNSISRCYSLRPLTINAFDLKPFSITDDNNCEQKEVEVVAVVQPVLETLSGSTLEFLAKRCCFGTVVYCAFEKTSSTGFCANRDYWMTEEVHVDYHIYDRTNSLCYLSAEALAIAQSNSEKNILQTTCSDEFSPEKIVKLVLQNGKQFQYISPNALNGFQSINSSVCESYTEETCLKLIASHFSNNTALVTGEALCDQSQNYIGYTAGLSCFGVAGSPCPRENSNWTASYRPITFDYGVLRVEVEVLSSGVSIFNCSISEECDTSTVTARGLTSVDITYMGEQSYTYIVSVVVNDNPFEFNIRGVEFFEISLDFNGRRLVSLRPPVIELTPPTRYLAARVDPSAGTYTIIDRFV